MTRFWRYLLGSMAGYWVLTLWPEGVPRPDPLLLALVQATWRKASPSQCAILGAAGGFGMALLGPGMAGVYVVVYGWTGLLLGLAGEGLPRSGPLVPALLVSAGTLCVALGVAGLGIWTEPSPLRVQLWAPGALLMNLAFWFVLLRPRPVRERRIWRRRLA